MRSTEFTKLPRGPYRFETWLWNYTAETELGMLPVELYCEIDCTPSDEMVAIANQLVNFARSHGPTLLDILYGHYRYAEEEGWLSHWNVSAGIGRPEILSQVKSVVLNVDQDLFASIHIDPAWDPEHKLTLTYEGGIVEVNGSPFRLKDGILSPGK